MRSREVETRIRPCRDALAAGLAYLAAAIVGISGVWWAATAPLGRTEPGSPARGVTAVEARNAALLGLAPTLLLSVSVGLVTYRLRQRARRAAERHRRRAEAVRQSEARFNQVAAHNRVMIWEVDASGRYTYVSRGAVELLGYAEEELVGHKYIHDLHPAGDRDAFRAATAEIFRAKGEFRNLTRPVQTKSGQLVWLSTHGMPVLDATGGLRGYRGADGDITERKRADEALAKRERCLSALVEVQRQLLSCGVAETLSCEPVLELLGRAAGASRVYVFESHRDAAGQLLVSQTAEWCAEGVPAQIGNPELQNLPLLETVPRWGELLARGEIVTGFVDEFPADERAILEPQGILSIAVLPLTVDGEAYGFIGFDDCARRRLWDAAELDLLRAAAAALSMLLDWRSSQRRLKTIVDAIPAGIVVVDRHTHVIADVNPAALAMFGAPRTSLVGSVCHKFICPAEVGRCPVTDLGQTVNSSERVLVTADGRNVPILKTVVPVNIRGREYLLETFIDITDQRRAQQELAAHRERLEVLVNERTQKLMEAERQMLQGEKLASVGRLAAGVAHELNTPIQYIGDNLHALADFYQDIRTLVDKYRELVALVATAQVQPEAVAQIVTAEREHDLEFVLEDAPKAISQGLDGVQRVANIVRAMKDFSHIKANERSSVDVNRCLQSTLTVARNEYKYVADVETDFGALPGILCYPSELNQVFLNILVNAAHAIQDTGRRGTITIATRLDGEFVEIAMADTGVGIPEEIRSRIYEPFFTTKAVGRGTGQGLSIAHQVVVGLHGGQLTCESEVGVGTTFRIRIPATQE